MKPEQITIIPNTHTVLRKASLVETEDGEFELELLPIVAWAVHVDRRDVDGRLLYSADAIDSAEGGEEFDGGYAVLNVETEKWHIPYDAAGKGQQNLIDYLRGASTDESPSA